MGLGLGSKRRSAGRSAFSHGARRSVTRESVAGDCVAPYLICISPTPCGLLSLTLIFIQGGTVSHPGKWAKMRIWACILCTETRLHPTARMMEVMQSLSAIIATASCKKRKVRQGRGNLKAVP